MTTVASLYDDIFPEPPALPPQSASATTGAGAGAGSYDVDTAATETMPARAAPEDRTASTPAIAPAPARPKNVPRVKGVQVPPKRRPTYLSMITRLLKEHQRESPLEYTSRSRIDDALWAQWFAGGTKAAPPAADGAAQRIAPPLPTAGAVGGDISREAFRARLRTALADAVASGMLLQKKQSFRLPKQSLSRGRSGRRGAARKKGAAPVASSRAKRPATADARAEDSNGNVDGSSNEASSRTAGTTSGGASPRADAQPAKRGRTASAEKGAAGPGKKRSGASRSQSQSHGAEVPVSSAAAST